MTFEGSPIIRQSTSIAGYPVKDSGEPIDGATLEFVTADQMWEYTGVTPPPPTSNALLWSAGNALLWSAGSKLLWS